MNLVLGAQHFVKTSKTIQWKGTRDINHGEKK